MSELKSSKAVTMPEQNGAITIQAALLQIIQNKDIEPERLERFLDLQIKMENRQAKMAFQAAMAGFQGDCPVIPKSKKVNFTSNSGKTTKYNYSPLDEIVEITKAARVKWGLSFSFNVKKTDNKNEHELITTIRHSSGHSEEFSHFFNPIHDDTRMNESQRSKSSITFAKRAGLESALGLVTADEDDDARSAHSQEMAPDKLVQIRELIKETKTDEPKLLSFLKIESLETMTDAEASRALHALKQKRSVSNV